MKHLTIFGKIFYYLGAVKLEPNYPKMRLLHPIGLLFFIIKLLIDFVIGGLKEASEVKHTWFVWW